MLEEQISINEKEERDYKMELEKAIEKSCESSKKKYLITEKK